MQHAAKLQDNTTNTTEFTEGGRNPPPPGLVDHKYPGLILVVLNIFLDYAPPGLVIFGKFPFLKNFRIENLIT